MAQTTSEGHRREIRIGLVMYGGVSLAIYMNGVAGELFRAVRGRGVYKLFKTLTDSDVVVDVVSGASAGGINGMFLAYALCNELEFSECADLWRKQGGIADLLRDPSSPARSQTSLLDSESYYEPQLAGAFRQMWQKPIDVQKERGAPSQLSELDLFVAGTDFNGRRTTHVDSAAHLIEVKDHRAKFWLKHRAGRKAQLDPRADALGRREPAASASLGPAGTDGAVETGFAAFAKLARITSCFPAAFAPVSFEVPEEGPAPADGSGAVAHKLGVWGQLAPGHYHFLDGGILDNKPFSSTIEAIFYRMAHRPVQRHLLYVEPDPERFQDEQRRVPTFLSSALDSLTRLPAYESIAEDLHAIGKHNDAIKRYERTCAELRNWVMGAPARAGGDSSADLEDGSGQDGVCQGESSRGGAARAIYERARLHSLADVVAAGLLYLEAGGRLDDEARSLMGELRRALDRAMTRAEARASGSGAVARGLLQRYDVDFRLRRLMHLTYVLVPTLPDSGESTNSRASQPAAVRAQGAAAHQAATPAELLDAEVSRAALLQIGHRVALLEIVRGKLLRAVERSAPAWRKLNADEVWDAVLCRLDAVLDIAGLPPDVIHALRGEQECEEQLERLSAALEARTARDYQPGALAGTSLLSLVDEGESKLVASFQASADVTVSFPEQERPVAHEYVRFELLDQTLFPIQFVAGLREQDIIRTVRVSPLDAQRGCSAGQFSEKVTGEALAHFGAFLKRSWRSNDIMYGRLDGACQLLETLLNPAWLRASLAAPGQRGRVLGAFGVAPDAQENATLRRAGLARWLESEDIFPGAPPPSVARVAGALSALLDPEPSDFERRLTAPLHGELLNAVIEAAHFGIVHEDYPKLIEDSVSEQLAWRSGRVPAKGEPGATGSAESAPARAAPMTPAPRPAKFDAELRAFDVTLDDFVVQAAARQFARDALSGSDTQRLVEMLRDHPVGREAIARDVPPSVLLELTAQALLVLRNCIINSFGPERAEALRRRRLYRVLVDWPLRGFYAIARLTRQRPGHGGLALGLLAYFLLAASVGLSLQASLRKLEGFQGYVAVLAFVALPLACFAVAAGIVAASQYSWKHAGSLSLRLARRLLAWVLYALAALVGLLLLYFAHGYVAAWISLGLERVLYPFGWGPASCNDFANIVLLLTAAALAFTLGSFNGRGSARRQPSAACVKPDDSADDTHRGGGPPSSDRSLGAAPVAAE